MGDKIKTVKPKLCSPILLDVIASPSMEEFVEICNLIPRARFGDRQNSF